MARELFLVVYRQQGPAHWSMLIPHENGVVKGKIIHAVGNPFQGYEVQIKPDYDLSKTNKRHEEISFGFIDEEWLPHLESLAHCVKAPGVSKKPLDPFAGENCQDWLEKYADLLVKEGAVLQSARDVLTTAPRT
ncbi:hypothetical protein N431DRAFT_513439 [Stipitochalara longipes BDJ]|nr:hypothetical protein N431DRAFT_513439 [Stipitochalara longipes BDJ]